MGKAPPDYESTQRPPEPEMTFKDMSLPAKVIYVFINWILKPCMCITLLYFFVCSLDLLSNAFQLLGGRASGKVFRENKALTNPLCNLMIGILSTVLVQSSSTSTSITVTMVANEILTVSQAIPMIMGANIGTSITNTIVSLAQSGNRDEFRRAFAGATVHDMFNWLCVVVLLPLEMATGYLYLLSKHVVDGLHLEDRAQSHDVEFLKVITEPLTSAVVQLDSAVLERVASGDQSPELANASLLRRWCAFEEPDYFTSDSNATSNLTSNSNTTYSNFFTRVGTTSCEFLFNIPQLSDNIIGAILLILSLAMLCTCLVLLVKILNNMLRGSVAQSIRRFINSDFPGIFRHLTGYFAIIVGAGLTIVVQSSSVFTSTLTPLVGVGVITIERVYPLTLGSNIGTTGTGMIAALASPKGQLHSALQIAFCHLFFNISGILLFYPIQFLRVPIAMAKTLGEVTAHYRWFAVVYVVGMYFMLPGFVFSLTLHPIVMYTVGIPCVVLLFCVMVINIMQRKCPQVLPVGLRTWDRFPTWTRSLEPYDRVFRKLKCCKCCDMCCGDEVDIENAKQSTIIYVPKHLDRGLNKSQTKMLLSPETSVTSMVGLPTVS